MSMPDSPADNPHTAAIKEDIVKIAFVNFGGIGDEVLFTPVINEVHQYLPNAHLTLIVEDRTGNIRHLLPHVDSVIDLPVQSTPRLLLFFKLWQLLSSKYFDVVISSGSSPFIPILLFFTGIRRRIGFDTGITSFLFLTGRAPLNRKAYAADMYFRLARTFLSEFLPKSATYLPPPHVAPALAPLPETDEQWAKDLLTSHTPDPHRKKILIHPGVSQISIRKKIFKSWSAENWALLIKKLTERFQVYLVGGPDDQEIIAEIARCLVENPDTGSAASDPHYFSNLYGQTKNLLQLAALIQQADVLVSVDSAPMHFAVGYHTPVVAMFGPTDPVKLLPDDARYRAVHVDQLACRPCLWDHRKTSCNKPLCLDVPMAKMYKAITEVLESTIKEEITTEAPAS